MAMIPKRDARPLEYAALLPMFGGMEKKPRYIDRDVVTMGRARGSDFCLDGNEVSALHCLIYKAADGYRVRDCGSRTGTRVNGQGIKTALLGNGDVLQIGPFSFEVRIPRTFQPEATADPHKTERLERSRRHLARAALRLRQKYRDLKARGGVSSPAVDKALADLKAKLKAFDQRVNQLELSEQELLQEREDQEKLRREFQRQVHIKETEIAERRKVLEREFQDRWEAVQKEVASLKRSSSSGASSADVQKLQQQQRELESLAQRLQKKDADLNAETQQLQQERDELERARAEIQEQQIEAQKMFESAQQEQNRPQPALDDADRDAAENDLLIQKAQLAAMMEEVKHLQEGLRRKAEDGEAEALQQQIAELSQQLDDARTNRVDEHQLRQIMSDVEVLQQQNLQLREQAAIADRVVLVEAENEELRQRLESAGGNGDGNPDVAAELERLRVENRNLLQLADEVQKQFSLSGSGFGNEEAIAALKRENEALRVDLNAAESATLDIRVTDLARENEELRHLLHDAESKLEKVDQTHGIPQPSDAGFGSGFGISGKRDDSPDLEVLNNEIRLLKELLGEKDIELRELAEASDRSSMGDTETYEAELNRFRKELESDRNKLNDEITSLRVRNQELDEATREMEMEMSRERAEMARERIRLDRLRDEIKVDMERMQREQEVRGTLGAVHKLRDELKSSNSGGSAHGGKGAPVADRLRSLRNH
jgi:pSer/pThr/pTyr-binding forkhead associated (FHA) protein